MASKLPEKQIKKIVADFAMFHNYSAVARMNGVSDKTVKTYVKNDPEFSEISEQKNTENKADILAYMESKKDAVCEIIGVGLEVLPEKIRSAKTASEVTTALGTLIDKFTVVSGGPADMAKEDGLSKSLKEMAEELESDD